MKTHQHFLAAACALAAGLAAADAPVTRAEMKAAVERQKDATPRLPLPPAAEGQRANNGAMQAYYLPAEWRAGTRPGGGGKGPGDAKNAGKAPADRSGMGAYNTELFWIVSRANDCRYCMGHQEVKLASAGYDDDRIAALDGDWQAMTPAQRAGLAYARRGTLEPHLVGAAELDALAAHYPPAQALAIVAAVAGFNRTNRWTGSLNIPQDREPFGKAGSLAGGVSPKFAGQRTLVAPSGAVPRPALEARAEAERQLAAAVRRTPHPLLPKAELFPGVPAWARIGAADAEAARKLVQQREALFAAGKLPALLKAKIHWVAARHDRAWAALADARWRLRALGESDEAIFALDAAATRAAADRAALALAERITIAPQAIADADFAPLREQFSAHEIAEIVWVAASAAWFDRITEPLRVPAEE